MISASKYSQSPEEEMPTSGHTCSHTTEPLDAGVFKGEVTCGQKRT